DPSRVCAFARRGHTWLAKREYDKAIKNFTEAIRLAPNDPTVRFSRGTAHHLQQAYQLAIDDYNKTIQLDPSNSGAYHNRGLVWCEQGEYIKAMKDLEEAIRLDPNNANMHYNIARLLAACPLEKCRDGKRAISLATKACELSRWKASQYFPGLAAAYAE